MLECMECFVGIITFLKDSKIVVVLMFIPRCL